MGRGEAVLTSWIQNTLKFYFGENAFWHIQAYTVDLSCLAFKEMRIQFPVFFHHSFRSYKIPLKLPINNFRSAG